MDEDVRRLVLEAGFAAVNHGLPSCARPVLDALPWLVPHEVPRAMSRAVLLYGLGQRAEAHALLDACHDDAAHELNRLLRSANGASLRD